ncbi:hypothetical protein Ancab_025753 [Ancistrocladus abbreviatus]
MDKTPPRIQRKKKTHKASSSKNSRFTPAEDTTIGGSVECSGKHCQSCTAALIADCVAVCCCPLAVVSLLALAFVKVPYVMGRRCLDLGKRKEQKSKCKRSESLSNDEFMIGRDGNLWGKGREGKSDIVFEFGEEEKGEERKSICAGFEAENFFFELYQVGQLGFGRVSFTGIQSFGKGN